MANKTNKAPKKAPAAPAENSGNPAESSVQNHIDFKNLMENMSSESSKGLDPNHQVDLLNLAHDIYGKDANAAKKYNMKQETVDKINEVVAIGVVVAIARETVCAKNPFAIALSTAELGKVKEICSEVGVSFNTNLLPAPKEDGTIEIPSNAIEVSKETVDKINEEEQIRTEQVETDPTKIENEEQLIASLKNIMVTRDNVYQKISDAINFYQAYLKVQASRAENKEEALKKVNEKDRKELLKEMAKLIGACPLVLQGVGRYMYSITVQSKSPISAFCMFRNACKNRKTGVYALTDAEVADYVRTLIEWTSDAKIAAEKERIDGLKKNLETLKKDEKKNAAGIKDTQAKIEIAEKNLAHFDKVLSYVLSPSAENLESIIAGYSAKDTVSIRTFKAIIESYYDDINVKEMKQDGIRHNAAQYAGIITNLFRDPSAKLDQYSESNLMQLEPINLPSEENTEAEEPKKDQA